MKLDTLNYVDGLIITAGRALPTMSGELCIAIRLGRQNTAAKSLVKPDLHLVPARPA